jgi:hypothetical protein
MSQVSPKLKEEPRELLELREEFDRELVRRAFQVGELERRVDEVRKEYEDSLSWRVTRPMRMAMDFLRHLRQR